MNNDVVWFDAMGINDVPRVGGKNASLGEMISHLSAAGVRVPSGFATSTEAYRDFLRQNGLAERIHQALSKLDVEDVAALADTSARIRRWIVDTPFPPRQQEAISTAYRRMEAESGAEVPVAVRSSATAEDLPDASFAGQQETYLNIRGLEQVLQAVKHVFASLFNDRAVAYRVHQGFEHDKVALSAGVQRMVRSDVGASGVMFTLDTESGFRDVVLITSSYGLGETVVQGAVNPDEFYVHKPTLAKGRPAVLRRNLGTKAIKMVYGDNGSHGSSVQTTEVPDAERRRFSLTDDEALALARQAVIIERHYGRPMDIEWGKDGADGRLYILQARPETVKSRADGTQSLQRYHLKQRGSALITGRSIGQRISAGPARVILDPKDMARVQPGDVLVTDMTDPDWEPVMKRAAAIVTNRGGRTCHAAIIARELGIPAIVGCGDATEAIASGAPVTVSCAEGDAGRVYAGAQKFRVEKISLDTKHRPRTKIMMNVGNPDQAFEHSFVPNDGVGLARLEFIINHSIQAHPRAL
ncbi:MAG: phosphoenolpyruvate synthase, partial [Gammaproteobacteria bacterium]|nr:phosphoenolpyruvate synthase [Gammaproteobacteria bacterium]